MSTVEQVTTKSIPTTITSARSNVKFLCPLCAGLKSVVEVKTSLLDLPLAVLSCGHMRGFSLPKASGTISVEDLCITFEENPELSELCQQLLPHDEAFPLPSFRFKSWGDNSRTNYFRAKHAQEAAIKAQADQLLTDAGFRLDPELEVENYGTDGDEIPEFDGGYAFGARECENDDPRFEGLNIVRTPSSSWDSINSPDEAE
jgi:hypothetical protein